MDPDKAQKFLELLEQNHQWPDYYTFKFIVKTEHQEQLLALLVGHDVQLRPSGKGTYVSVTSRVLITATEQVLEVYRTVLVVPGVVSL